jgi:predicted RNA-binding protein with PIN domain
MRPSSLTIVDAANVVGSRPDGWWRDRAGAARRLVQSIARAHPFEGDTAVVLEGQARAGVPEGDQEGVRVVHAPASGDDQIVEIVKSEAALSHGREVTVITSDRELRERVAAHGARSLGPRALRSRLETYDRRDQRDGGGARS